MPKSVKVFVSYAPEDEGLCKVLEKHLSSLQRDGLVETWQHQSINAGVDRVREIDYHLNTARVILLLISADFLASDYCYSIEMEQAIARHKTGEACVIPVILRSVDWKTSPLKELQALPMDGIPVTSLHWHTQDEAFLDVVEGIRTVIERLNPTQTTPIAGDLTELGDTIPEVKNFVGRTEDIGYYRESLDRDGIAIIEGMPGIGKTSLGAKLAESTHPQNTFWMTFRPGLNDDLDSVFWLLGSFFSTKLNNHRLSRVLEQEHNSEVSYSPTAKSRLLIKTLIATSSLLCFDDFHVVLENKPIVSLFQEIITTIQHVKGKNAKILIMTREHPFEVTTRPKNPLKGLTLPDTRSLLTDLKTSLTEAQFLVLHKYTKGNPQFLRAFQYLLLSNNYQVDLLQKLSQISLNQDIWDFLIESVHQSLSENEQRIFSALSIMRWPSPPRQIGEVSGSPNSFLILRKLSKKFLLEEPSPDRFSLHPLIKDFFSSVLDTHIRKDFHARAAASYVEVQEHVEAIYHYWQAGKLTEAIQHLTQKYYEIKDGGRAGNIYQIILAMGQAHLSPMDWLMLQKVKGELELFQGKYEDAIVTFQVAQNSLRATDIQKADFWRYIGNAQGHVGKYEEAIESFRRGLTILGNKDSSVFALINIDMGYILYRKREYADAQLAIESGLQVLRGKTAYQVDCARGLRHLGDVLNEIGLWSKAIEQYSESMSVCRIINDEQGLARCYDDLGNIYYHKGEWKKAIEFHRKAIESLERIGDLLGLAIAYSNLGNVQFVAGDWDSALASHQQSLSIGEQIDNILGTAIGSNSIGNIYRARGDWATALKHYQRSLQIGIQLNDLRGQTYTHGYLGLTYYEMGELDTAFDHFTKALRCADTLQSKLVMGLARLNMVIMSINLEDLNKATIYLGQANDYFTEIGAKFECGLAFRLRGELDLINKNVSRAIENFKQAEVIFHDLNSQFEVAKTQTGLSKAYKASGDKELSRQYAKEAFAIFERRDAKGEIKKVKDLL